MSSISQTDQPTAQSPESGGEAGSGTGALGALCPYCGGVSRNMVQCEHCRGKFEPLSRQATQNAMGPWQIKDPKNPFLPGCSYERLRKAVESGRVTRSTVVRGPTTRQFWSFACNAPGVAVLLGECHACHEEVRTDEYMCGKCGVLLSPATDRQSLGLSAVTLLPGEAPAEVVASTSIGAITRPAAPSPLKAGTLKPEITPEPAMQAPAPAKSQVVIGDQLAELERRKNIEATRLRSKVLAARVIAGAFVISTLALAATLVVLVMDPARGVPVVEVDAGARERAVEAAGNAEPAPMPVEEDLAEEVGDALDPALEAWRAEIEAAAVIAEDGELASLEEAATRLRAVLDAARLAHPDADFEMLEERVREYTARADNIRLREML